MTMGIRVVREVEIWFPDQISVSPMGWRSAARRVATFLPMTEGHVACPLVVWNASSKGQCLNLSEAWRREALAVAPRAPSSLRI